MSVSFLLAVVCSDVSVVLCPHADQSLRSPQHLVSIVLCFPSLQRCIKGPYFRMLGNPRLESELFPSDTHFVFMQDVLIHDQ
jgi:hypothetical protein